MEGHADMDMAVTGEGSFLSRLFSGKGFTAASHYFVMDWASVWTDILIGLLIAGALAAWVPEHFWQDFFLTSHPTWAKIEGPLVGPLVAVVSFVCSVGNVPLAAVLWKGGISFGGVVSFIFADLIVLPVLDIYRKYYGWKVMLYILGTFYVTMAAAGYVIEVVFGALGIIPTDRNVAKITEGITFNYTTVLNILFLVLAAVLVWRFLRTGGPAMLRMMSKPAEEMDHGTRAGETGMAMNGHGAEQVTDPVCGMRFGPQQAAGTSEYQGQTYYFCSQSDKEAFDREPGHYVGQATGEAAAHAMHHGHH